MSRIKVDFPSCFVYIEGMTSGYSMRHIIKNFIRIQLDDYGAGDVRMVETDAGWKLYESGKAVGKAYYTLDNVIIEYRP